MKTQLPDTNTLNKKKGSENSAKTPPEQPKVKEIGGPEGPEPTRYGDWEVGGRCSDF